MNTLTKQELSDNVFLTIFACALPVFVFASKVSADAIFSLTSLVFLFFIFKTKTYDWLKWPWVQAVFVFSFFGMVTAIFSPYPQEAFTQAFIYIRWPLTAIALIVTVFNYSKRLYQFEKTVFIVLSFLVIDGVFQFFMGFDIFGKPLVDNNVRMTGPFSKPFIGVYSFKMFFFAFLFVYMAVEKTNKNIIGLSVLVLSFNVFLLMTGERIIFLLSVLFFFIWLIGVCISYQALRKKMIPLAVAAFSIFSMIIAFNHAIFIKRVMPFIEAMKNFTNTTYGDIFHSAFQLWQLSPWVGIGTRMYNKVCVLKLGYTEDELLYQTVEGVCVRHPHNIYLEVLSQNGLLGLLIFLGVLFFIFKELLLKELWRKDFLMMLILSSSVLVIFWPLATSMSIFSNNYAGVVWLTIAWAIARARSAQKGLLVEDKL